MPDELDAATVARLEADLAGAIRTGVRPLRRLEWRQLLESEGFTVEIEALNEFHLLEPRRVLADEGVRAALRIVVNLLRDARARRRALQMRKAIQRHAEHMRAIMLFGVRLA